MGAQLAILLASELPHLVRGVVVVSAETKPAPFPGPTLALLSLAAPLARHRRFAAAQARQLGIPNQLLDDYLHDSTATTRETLLSSEWENRLNTPTGTWCDELFQWWSDRVGATDLALYGRKLWETMSSHWPTADQQPGATPADIEFARRWQAMPKMVFSSTTRTVDWNTRLVTGDAVSEIIRLKADDGGSMDIGGATLAAAAMRAGLIDEYLMVTHPILVGGGTPFFTSLDSWVNLNLVETRTFPGGVVLTRYEARR
jgi:dihydrofolate reductase